MILDRLFSRATQPADPARSGGRSLIFGLPQAGIRVDEETALNYSAVWAAVSMIAHTLGVVSWHVVERQDGRRTRLFDVPLARLLNVEPNPEMGPQAFKHALAMNALLWGTGYAEIERDGSGRPVALWPIPSRKVEPKRRDNGALYYEVREEEGGRATEIPARDMFAPIGLSFDGIVGISPIRRARESISMGLAMENYGASFFGNDARPSFVLEAPDKLSEQAVENLRAWVNRNHGGARNKWKPGVFEQGTTLKTIGMPNDDAQFLESRKFQIGEIARWFNIPPHKIGDLERATFNNIDSRERMYVTEAVLPWARGFEEEGNRKLIAPSARSRIYTKMDLNSLMRGDVKTRTEHYKTMFGVGAYSPNDIRALEDMNPIRGGNQHMVPGNMVPLEQAGSQMAPKQAMFDVFVDVADRMLRKQYKAVTRAASKDGFIEWLHEFYEGHRTELCEAFQAPLHALAKHHQSEPPTGALSRWAAEHCRSAVELLGASENVESDVHSWTNRSLDMASEVIEAVSDALTTGAEDEPAIE